MRIPKFVAAGAALGLALTLSGCGSDAASDAVSSAAAQVSEAVSSAAAEASAAASSVAAEASEAASSAMAEASEAVSSAKAEITAGATYTLDDVAAHSSSGDCWVAIDGKVYDLTKWEDQHPGGKDKIVQLCGTDATSAFSGQHSDQPAPNAALLGFQIGTLG